MGTNNSIFDFGDKFGIESPFGDWRKEMVGGGNGPKVREVPPQLNAMPLADPEQTSAGHMITLTNVVKPENGQPGSATFTITMTYRIVTIGEGIVPNWERISTADFARLYSKGNFPTQPIDVSKKRWMLLKTLPSKDLPAIDLSEAELLKSKQTNTTSGIAEFWEYYQVSVQYNYTLVVEKNYSLWKGLRWVSESIETRGLVCNIPFAKVTKAKYDAINSTTSKKVLQKLNKEERKIATEEYVKAKIARIKSSARMEFDADWDAYLMAGILGENKQKYSQKIVFVGGLASLKRSAEPYMKKIKSNIYLGTTLAAIGSTISWESPPPGAENWIELEEIDQWITFSNPVRKFISYTFQYLEYSLDQSTGKHSIGGAAMNEQVSEKSPLNIIILNPHVFVYPYPSGQFDYYKQTEAEVIVHESGHNAAAAFAHSRSGKNGPYEYDDTGLQSNSHGFIYPTEDNTIGILNDPTNRFHMEIR
jgi:hypothetical protein